MVKSPLLVITSVMLASCSTLLNSGYKRVDVLTSGPATVICLNNKDTLHGTEVSTYVKRSKEQLRLIVIGDSSTVSIVKNRKISFTYYLDFFLGLPWAIPAVIIDSYSPKRFTYPGFVYVDLDGSGKKIKRKHRPLPSTWARFHNSVKVAPLKFIDFANPGIEFAYERNFARRLGIHVQASALAPPLPGRDAFALKGMGFGAEPRFYFAHRFNQRWFTGLKASWSQIRYQAFLRYYEEDDAGRIFAKQATVNRTIVMLIPKIGYQLAKGAFMAEISFGVGIKYRAVEHLDKVPGTSFYADKGHINFTGPVHHESKGMEIGTPLSFMIGWKF